MRARVASAQDHADETSGACLAMDDRFGIAAVDNAVEVDMAQPAGGLAGIADEPCPVCVVVAIDLAVRLADIAGSDDGIVQATPVDPPIRPDPTLKLFGEPGAITMAGGGIKPVGIDLVGKDGQVAPAAPEFLPSCRSRIPARNCLAPDARFPGRPGSRCGAPRSATSARSLRQSVARQSKGRCHARNAG